MKQYWINKGKIMNKLLETDLILNLDESIYHLNLRPEELADTVILVGDPGRVPKTSVYFDRIEVKKQKREFVTHTGYIGKKRLSVISTGIGTGNIDIVMNELDALVNIDFTTRNTKKNLTSLNIIHMGTSGCLSKEIPVDSFVVSTAGLALDGLLSFYDQPMNDNENAFLTAIKQHFKNLPAIHNAYFAEANKEATQQLAKETNSSKRIHLGITLTCSGFYGPQGRQLRAPLAKLNLLDLASNFAFNNDRMVNFEMETATIFALARLLNHRASSIGTIVANRITHQFSENPDKAVKEMIEHTLEILEPI
jgi:uridine phosphorylase